MQSESAIEVCPICGNSDLYYEAGSYIGKVYHCKNCGYIGSLVVEADQEMIEAIKADYEQSKNEGRSKKS